MAAVGARAPIYWLIEMALPFNQRVLFPSLTEKNNVVKSTASPQYNCIAWAYDIDNRRMWPNNEDYWWPDGVRDDESIDAFVALFKGIGYEGCETNAFEAGYEKIAIYADVDEPLHAARQLPSGWWTSKLGDGQDIEHAEPGNVEGRRYGRVAVILKRRLPTAKESAG